MDNLHYAFARYRNIINHGRNVALSIIAITFLSSCAKTQYFWHVEEGLESAWAKVLKDINPPVQFKEMRTWNGGDMPEGKGIIVAKKPWKTDERITVYNRLSFNLEYNGAFVLAVDPWLVFRKHTDPALTANRAYSGDRGDGVLLIPGSDTDQTEAWIARLILGSGANFPPAENIWLNTEENLFRTNRFPNGASTYTWPDVFYRLMGSETAWVYAPVSKIRNYQNSRKSILEATPFPEADAGRYSLQVSILWALPLNLADDEKSVEIIAWLKNPDTQTIIANQLEWIPADPYGKPYDPASFASHRYWLVATNIYEVN